MSVSGTAGTGALGSPLTGADVFKAGATGAVRGGGSGRRGDAGPKRGVMAARVLGCTC
jgi:hypothetical protein